MSWQLPLAILLGAVSLLLFVRVIVAEKSRRADRARHMDNRLNR